MEQDQAHALRDRAAVRFPPPLVFLLSLGGAYGVHRLLLPLTLPRSGWLLGGGALLVALGVFVAALALERFFRSGQNPEPWTPSPELVRSGIYGLTRNPMYLGMALVQAGLGLFSGVLWVTLFTPLSMALVHRIAIRHEEAYLARKFGADYEAYRRTVRRWL